MDEMNETELAQCRSALTDLKASLVEVLERTSDGTRPVKLKDNQGRLSRMDELHNQSILKANRTVLENRLRTVRQAEARLVDDSYGYCLECGEPVGLQRLLAYPDAALCIACQSDAER